ncbi:molecular chaperone Hsp33 [Hydrogenivirga caldilitoris]|uniref:33 kDa chaperonin n=1 Tax=Hydrogenivirga caldilitoris TaxID=246264 RepID=A0A497XNC1_9AQUI|nr:Hsp33 family molecular chaperone HslO [Hydrogenivirga caldilitoris]RLJ70358.1 molecular chaperone Hsp33 [Hydrogenivirga caldilitoris]
MIQRELSKETREDLKNYFADRDYMVIAVPRKEPARVYVVKATNAVETARRIHNLSPGATVALGRALVGVLLLTSLVKHATDQKVLLKIEGDGPIGTIYAEADGKGRVRGFVENPQVDTFTKEVNGKKKFDVSRIVGRNGNLTVVKELRMGTPYTSIVPLVSGEIAQDLAYYFSQSEQIPSAVGIGVLVNEDGSVKHAGGFLVQTLGGISDKVVDLLEHRVNELPPLTELMEEGKRPEDIAIMLLDGLEPQLIGLKEVEYYCPCDEEIARSSLLLLTEGELNELLEEGPAEVVCKFCGRVYRFTREDLQRR